MSRLKCAERSKWTKLTGTSATLRDVLALKGVVLFCLGAHVWGVERFYVYALLLLAGFLGAEVLVATRGIPRIYDVDGMLGLPGLVMLPVGATLLVRFLRKYPQRGEAA